MMRARFLDLKMGGEAFTPHAPTTTAEATQMGWYKSAGGLDYTVFYWPSERAYTVHDSELEPATMQVFTSKQDAVSYIQTELDKGYVAPAKKLDPTWAFSNGIEATNGVDTWGGDYAIINHNGDWIRFHWLAKDQGAQYYVAYEYEKGDISMLPQDFEFTLMPGERKTIYNTETRDTVMYNVRVRYEGPVDLSAPSEQPTTEAAPSRTYFFNGPVMSRLRGLLGR